MREVLAQETSALNHNGLRPNMNMHSQDKPRIGCDRISG